MRWGTFMAYLYQLANNENTNDIALYDYVEIHKILTRTLVESKDEQYYKCTYTRNGRYHRKRVSIKEGNPTSRSFAFYLNDRDDERAIYILKQALREQNKDRRKRLSQEGRKYVWELTFVESLSIDNIDEKRSNRGETKRSGRNKATVV